jgi:BirA family biotin operon repressor/biotin-[acetyl-CoA-carboxylase] ligase
VVEVTGSTQDDLAALVARDEAINGAVLVTEYQSAGRGRLDRTFDAPQSSALLFSLFIEPKREKNEWSFLPLLAGLVSTLAISELDPRFTVELKWPNDLQIAGKKLGGIIAQATDSGVVIGIGINVGMNRSELPIELATSLMIEEFGILDRNLILASILKKIFGVFKELNIVRNIVSKSGLDSEKRPIILNTMYPSVRFVHHGGQI